MLASWCLADPPAVSGNNNNLLFHRAAWSLSCGYHLGDPQAERGVLSERGYLHLRPCLTSSGEQELLIAVLLHLVLRAAPREVHNVGKGRGLTMLFLSPTWISTPLNISQTFPIKPVGKRPCFCEKVCFWRLGVSRLQKHFSRRLWKNTAHSSGSDLDFITATFHVMTLPVRSLARLETEATVVRFGSGRAARWYSGYGASSNLVCLAA